VQALLGATSFSSSGGNVAYDGKAGKSFSGETAPGSLNDDRSEAYRGGESVKPECPELRRSAIIEKEWAGLTLAIRDGR
jgi:hypothetical protein